MAPKSKGPGGKAGDKPAADSVLQLDDQPGLKYFQEVYRKYKSNAADFFKANGPHDALQKYYKESSDSTVRVLAGLCLARVLYDDPDRKGGKKGGSLEEAIGTIRPMVDNARGSGDAAELRSMSACALLVAACHKLAKQTGSWETCLSIMRDVMDIVGGATTTLVESQWRDPAEEAIVDPESTSLKREVFEKHRGSSKSERLQSLRVCIGIEKSAAEKGAMLQNAHDANGGTGSQTQAPKQQKQPLTAEEQAAEQQRKAVEEHRVGAEKDIEERAKQRAQTEAATKDIMDAIAAKLDEAGPEGSKARVARLCELVGGSVKEFEEYMNITLRNGWATDLRDAHTRLFAAQFARFQKERKWLALRKADLVELMKVADLTTLVRDAMQAAPAAATAKEDSSRGEGGKSGGASKKGGKGGAKGGGQSQGGQADKAAAASAPAAASSEQGAQQAVFDVPQFLDWFAKELEDNDEQLLESFTNRIKKHLFAGSHGEDRGSEEFLQKLQKRAPSLAQVFLAKVAEQPEKPSEVDLADQPEKPSEESDRLLTELSQRLLEGGSLLACDPPAAPEHAEKWERSVLLQERWAWQLRQLPPLQQNDVLDCAAQIFCNLVQGSLSTSKELDIDIVPKLLALYEPPERWPEPAAMASRVGDPQHVLLGYTAVLRSRGVLPLERHARPEASVLKGMDADDVRLVRLCNHLLALPDASDAHHLSVLFVSVFWHKRPEYVEMVRRLFGELPSGAQDKLAKVTAAADKPADTLALQGGEDQASNGAIVVKAADGDDVGDFTKRDTAVALSGAAAGDGAVAAASDADVEEGAIADINFMEFAMRTELPDAERERLMDQWRKDVMDAWKILVEDASLGRSLPTAVCCHVARALSTQDEQLSASEVPVEPRGLAALVGRLAPEPLLQLRVFLLCHLGERDRATKAALQGKMEEWERTAREEIWLLDVQPGEGAAGDRVVLSEAAYKNLAGRVAKERARQSRRLRLMHAMKRALDERRAGPAIAAAGGGGGGKPVLALPPAGAPEAAGGGGGSKKKKGGGGGGAAAAGAYPYALPPLPPGVEPLDARPEELLDAQNQAGMHEAWWAYVLPYPDLLCSREADELLQEVVEPPAAVDAAMRPGTKEAEAAVIGELVGMPLPVEATLEEQVRSDPLFTLVDVMEELGRGALLEALRREEQDTLQGHAKSLLKHWERVQQELKDLEDVSGGGDVRQKVMDQLESSLSPWAWDLISKASDTPLRRGLGGSILAKQSLTARARDIRAVRGEALASAFRARATLLRLASAHYVSRLQVQSDVQIRLRKVVEELRGKTKETAQGEGKGGAKGGGGKGKKSEQVAANERQKLAELEHQLKVATEDMAFCNDIRDSVNRHCRALENQAFDAQNKKGPGRDGYSNAMGMGGQTGLGDAAEPGPAIAAAMIEALRALEVYHFNVSLVDRVAEQVTLSARWMMFSAVMNDPVLDAGVTSQADKDGVVIPRAFLRDQLRERVNSMQAESFILAEQAEKAKKQEAEQARKEARLKQEAERMQKEREEREAKRREEEEARAKERKAREEKEAAERKDETSKRKKGPAPAAHEDEDQTWDTSPDSILQYIKEEGSQEAARAEEERKPPPKAQQQQQGGKAGGGKDAGGAAAQPPAGAAPPRKGGAESLTARLQQKKAGTATEEKAAPPPAAAAAAAAQAASGLGSAKGPEGPQRRGGAQQAPPAAGGAAARDAAAAAAANQRYISVPRGELAGEGGKGGGAAGRGAGAPAPPPAAAQGATGQGGRGDRPVQLQQQQGRGGQAGGAGGRAAKQQGQQQQQQQGAPSKQFVPGFHPEDAAQEGKEAEGKRRKGRNRGGGGGGGDKSAAQSAAASAAAAVRGGGPGASGMFADAQMPGAADEVGYFDLTGNEEGAGSLEPQEAAEGAQYPFPVPYPHEPPEGWQVFEGYLFPAHMDPDAEYEAEAAGAMEPEWEADGRAGSFRTTFLRIMAAGYLREHHRQLPPELRSQLPAPRHEPEPEPERPAPLPYAVPANVPPESLPGGVPPYGVAAAPPFGPPFGARPPMLPPHLQHLQRPPFLPPAAPPPYAAPYGAPYGQQAALGLPLPYGAPAMPQRAQPPARQEAQEPEAEEDDTDDLMGLLGVPVAPQPARPALPPVAAPGMPYKPGPYGGFPIFAPPPAQALAQLQAPEYDFPPAAAAEDEAPYPPAAAPYAPGGAGRAGAGQQAAAAAKSWATVAKKGEGVPKAAAPYGGVLALTGEAQEEEDEDKQLQSALAQSLHDNRAVAFPPLGGPAAAAAARGVRPPSLQAAPGALVLHEPSAVAGTGLVNRAGEYNCFLNVIIQCLWHCAAFRQQLSGRRPEDHGANPVVAALLRLFGALERAEAQAAGQAAAGGGTMERQVVDPSELREALDKLRGYSFRSGEMNDPSEVLGALFEQLNREPALAGGPGQLSLVDRVFGLVFSEEVRCARPSCGKVTHVVAQHVEHQVVLMAAALRDIPVAMDFGPDVSMGRIIRTWEAQHTKRCDRDPPHHGCDAPTPVFKRLHNTPDVLTILLAWEPDVSADTIGATLERVDTVLQPEEVFPGEACPHNIGTYALHAMFCYYGQHYFAFINRGGVEERAQAWVLFDDASISAVGPWAAVVAKCRAGRIQPSVLFYQRMTQR